MSQRILVVDDDDSVRAMLARLLESEGFTAVGAHDAVAARRALADGDWALAVVDVVMPGESGISLARFARQAWPAMPVVLISGYPSVEAWDLPAVDRGVRFIAKPFGAGEFLGVVDSALRTPLLRE